jgi:hypothetical protein
MQGFASDTSFCNYIRQGSWPVIETEIVRWAQVLEEQMHRATAESEPGRQRPAPRRRPTAVTPDTCVATLDGEFDASN